MRSVSSCDGVGGISEESSQRSEEVVGSLVEAALRNNVANEENLLLTADDVVDGLPGAAVSYKDDEEIDIRNIGALTDELEDELLIALAKKATQKGKSIIILPSDAFRDFYLERGFVESKKGPYLVLKGDDLHEMAEGGDGFMRAKYVRKNALRYIDFVLEKNNQGFPMLVLGDSALYDAALSYEEREGSFHIKYIGSRKSGEGRKLIAQLSSMALSAQKVVTLCSDSKKIENYYSDCLGFEADCEGGQFILRSENLEKLASEYEG